MRIWSAARRGTRTVARDILDYVLRDMTHPEGGFYSAEDADSEGHEGKFYCWTRAELAELLTPEEFKWRSVTSASPSRAISWTTAIPSHYPTKMS